MQENVTSLGRFCWSTTWPAARFDDLLKGTHSTMNLQPEGAYFCNCASSCLYSDLLAELVEGICTPNTALGVTAEALGVLIPEGPAIGLTVDEGGETSAGTCSSGTCH